MPRYIVPIVYSGQEDFLVVAANPEEAKEKAEEMFRDGQPSIHVRDNTEDVERIGEPEVFGG